MLFPHSICYTIISAGRFVDRVLRSLFQTLDFYFLFEKYELKIWTLGLLPCRKKEYSWNSEKKCHHSPGEVLVPETGSFFQGEQRPSNRCTKSCGDSRGRASWDEITSFSGKSNIFCLFFFIMAFSSKNTMMKAHRSFRNSLKSPMSQPNKAHLPWETPAATTPPEWIIGPS